MLVSVSGPAEAEIAVAAGVDAVELRAAPSAEKLGAFVTAVGGRAETSVAIGDLAIGAEALRARLRSLAEAGIDSASIDVTASVEDLTTRLSELGSGAGRVRLRAVLYADRKAEPEAILPALMDVSFTGVRLDIFAPGGRLLTHADAARLASFVRAARASGLAVGLAGGPEAPDVPRLLALRPDFLGFSAAPRAGETGTLGDALAEIRGLIARQPGSASHQENTDMQGKEREPGAFKVVAQSIFVRDFVLPVRIGAYEHERAAPQNVRFDVTVEVAPGEGTGMGAVVSYDLITDGICALVAEGHVDLVETLAERIAGAVLGEPRARRVTVRVEKLETGPGGVGVELTMTRAGPTLR